MKKKINAFVLILMSLIAMSSCDRTGEEQVTLSGQLINWGNAEQLLVSNAPAADFGLGEDHVIVLDNEGRFELVFKLERPTYFSLGRNKLYLQPGEKLQLTLDYKDPEKAIFKGDHAHLQAYLATVPFPKVGSYLAGGRNIHSSDIHDIQRLAEEEFASRKQQLEKLNGPEEFERMEILRLRLDALNTLLSFPIYGSFKGYWDANEIQKAEILLPSKDYLNALAKDIMQDVHMQHPNFREMLYELVDSHLQDNGIFADLSFTPAMQSYDAFGALVKQLELEGLTRENASQLSAYLVANPSGEYHEMANRVQQAYAPLLMGQPAIDLIFTDATGQERNLSEFKGNLIYVDLWATWCGPCIDELPSLQALKTQYKDEPVIFLPLSIDSDLEAWQAFLGKHQRELRSEFVINRSLLDVYKLVTIPRYLLIDRDFKIISVFAPKPSDHETKELIDEWLGKE